MALQKDIVLPTGVTANYIRYKRVEVLDRDERKACIIFSLFLNKAVAETQGGMPLIPIWGWLRLNGEAFDRYFSNKALSEDKLLEIAYEAAKNEIIDTIYGSKKFLEDAIDV